MKETDYRKSPLEQPKLPTNGERFRMWRREKVKSMKEWFRVYRSLLGCLAFFSVTTTFLAFWIRTNIDPVGVCYLSAWGNAGMRLMVTEPLQEDREILTLQFRNSDETYEGLMDRALTVAKKLNCPIKP